MSKFKVGDSLVVVKFLKFSISPNSWKIGDELTVLEVLDRNDPKPIFYRGDNHKVVLFEEELEHSFIYNSPLEKVLR